MKAIILAAGKGTRLQPLTLEISKAMVEVYGKPLLAHNMDKLLLYVDEFIIVVKYKQEKIREYFWEEYKGIKVSYHKQGEESGTWAAIKWIQLDWDIVIAYADALFSQRDIDAVMQEQNYAVLVKKVENPEKYGIFKIDSQWFALEVVEKPMEYIWNLANFSFFKVNASLLQYVDQIGLSPRWELEITDAINLFIQKNKLKTIILEYDFIDITSIEDLKNANNLEKPRLWITKYLENIWEYEVHLGIPKKGIQEIVDYTLDPNDTALREGTGDAKKRFISQENLTAWYNDVDRYPFTLLDISGKVVWIWWGRPAKTPHVSEIHDQGAYNILIENQENIHTSGIRIYPSARGKWLASKFIEVCSRCYELIFPWFCMSDDIGSNNIASQKSFEKLWFQKVGSGKNINNSPYSGDIRFVYIKKY